MEALIGLFFVVAMQLRVIWITGRVNHTRARQRLQFPGATSLIVCGALITQNVIGSPEVRAILWTIGVMISGIGAIVIGNNASIFLPSDRSKPSNQKQKETDV